MVKPVTRVVKNVTSPMTPGRATKNPAPQVKKETHRQPHASVRAVNKVKTGRVWNGIKSAAVKMPKWNDLPKDRQLDVIGVGLIIVGLLTLLSLITEQDAPVSAQWVVMLSKLAGWGMYALPFGFLVAGFWLVFRTLETIPPLTGNRAVGIFLLYWNLLTWVHLLAGGGWEMAREGSGGGFLGAFFERLLMTGLGLPGTLLILVVWMVISGSMALRLPFSFFRDNLNNLRRQVQNVVDGSPMAAMMDIGSYPAAAHTPTPSVPSTSAPLPPGFHPLDNLSSRKTAVKRVSVASVRRPEVTKDESPIPPVLSVEKPGSAWVLPRVNDVLDPAEPVFIQGHADTDRARKIEETLRLFSAPVHVVDIQRGPTVTQYGVEPDFIENRNGQTRVRVSKIVNLADDLALALSAQRIRIQAPVPGRGFVGIEIPNEETNKVTLKEMVESEAFKKVRSPLRIALGKDVSGKPIVADLGAMPHLLIAGTTGSGKSVCENSILACLLMNNTPDTLRLVLIDPKRVEMTGYNHLPHLLAPVITEAAKVPAVLQWMITEMDSRYERFAKCRVRNIAEFNNANVDHLPYIVVVVDELADLMMLARDETEKCITRLAQLARATGIHMILATQRPSVNVVTGLIKANFPARIAFSVTSNTDSRVILDQPGAERLLGKGDMLYQAPDAPAPVRLQGVYTADAEINRLVDHWRIKAADAVEAGQTAAPLSVPMPTLPSTPLRQPDLWGNDGSVPPVDPMYDEAVSLVRTLGRASISMLQRRLSVGYNRSARLVDTMEKNGIIGPSEPGSQTREVLDYGAGAPPADPEKD
jgi:S-DNA-T family DNA segregation ATPase FtsK/SpoIIIE